MKRLPPVFIRRFNGHKLEKIMRKGAINAYWDTTNREQFKKELASSAVDVFLYTIHRIESEEELTKEDMDTIVDYIIGIYGSVMDMYYNNLRKDYPMG